MIVLKVQLLEVSHPPVWRVIAVPPDYTLHDLHEAIQDAMGWENKHHFKFEPGYTHAHNRRASTTRFPVDRDALRRDSYDLHTMFEPPRTAEYAEVEREQRESDELEQQGLFGLHHELPLTDVIDRHTSSEKVPYFVYTYDMGDEWVHTITVLEDRRNDGCMHDGNGGEERDQEAWEREREREQPSLPPQQRPKLPHVCLKAKGACPPEDVGGPWGFEDFKEACEAYRAYMAREKQMEQRYDKFGRPRQPPPPAVPADRTRRTGRTAGAAP